MQKAFTVFVFLFCALLFTGCGSGTESTAVTDYTEEKKQALASALGLKNASGFKVLEYGTISVEDAPESWKVHVSDYDNMEKLLEVSPPLRDRDEEMLLDKASVAGAFIGMQGVKIDPDEISGFSNAEISADGKQYSVYFIVTEEGDSYLDITVTTND